MSEALKTTTAKFDEEIIHQARERFGYVDTERQYKIRDLSDALLPDRTPEAASRLIRKEVRAIHDAEGMDAPTGQYKFTVEEATILSLQIEEKLLKENKNEKVSVQESDISEVRESSEQVVEKIGDAATGEDGSVKAESETETETEETEPAETDPVKAELEPDSAELEPVRKQSAPADVPAEEDAIEKARYAKRQIRGNVVSKSGRKSIVVLVERKVKHPLYKKYIRRSSKLHAHDEHSESAVGDVVSIESCRPISKTKCWRLVKVVSHVQ